MFHSIESIDNKLYNIFSTGSNDRTENSGHPCNHPASIFFMVDPPCLSCMIAFWSWSILHFLMLNPSGWIKVIHQPENHRHKAILEWFPPYKHIPKEYVTREVLIKFIHIFSKYYCWYPFISHKSQIISHWHPYIKPLLNPYSHFYHPIKNLIRSILVHWYPLIPSRQLVPPRCRMQSRSHNISRRRFVSRRCGAASSATSTSTVTCERKRRMAEAMQRNLRGQTTGGFMPKIRLFE